MKTFIIFLGMWALPAWAANTYYLSETASGGFYVVDLFEQRPDGFQDRIQHFEFQTPELARRKAAELKRTYPVHASRPLSRLAHYATGSVWTVVNTWNENWEDKYTQWMTQTLTRDFFVRHRIATDCADVAISMRWIFARIHGLPAGNHIYGSGQLFTQDSAPADWMKLPTHANWDRDQRFLTALSYMHRNTDTKTLFDDLYPIGINARALSAGAVWLIRGIHTLNVGKIDLTVDQWLPVYSSTTPREVRELEVETFQETAPIFGYEGFQRPLWLERTADGWRMLEATQMPWYSLEQYEEDDFEYSKDEFAGRVYARLSGNSLDPVVQLRGAGNDLISRFHMRQEIVEDGFERCYPNHCPPGSAAYEGWSTPSRDQHILERIERAEALVQANPRLATQWRELLDTYVLSIYDRTTHHFYLEELIAIWKARRYNSDPNQPILVRWGI